MVAKTSKFSIPLCRHIKTDGHRCGSPALTARAYCFHHLKLHRTRVSPIGSGPGLSTHVLYPLRNAHSVQHAIAMVVTALATGQLHPKCAGKMLFALQMAASNIRESLKE